MFSIKYLNRIIVPTVKPNSKIITFRFFATDSQLKDIFCKSRVSRVSVYKPRANELIVAVQEGNYRKAEIMVMHENVNIDGHDSGENTVLTDAAKRGDHKAIEFLIKKLNANPHASCDCPYHKTALHYASENGHNDAVKLLLDLGANPNIRDSRHYKAIDVSRSKEITKILELHESKYSNKYLGLKKDSVEKISSD